MNQLRWRALLIPVFFLVCIAVTSQAPAARKVIVAVNSNWPPMEMTDKKGKPIGYEIDLINAVAREAGFQVQFTNVPWKRIFNELDAGKYDAVIASVTITDGRKEKYDFSEPYFTAEQYLVVPKANAQVPLNGKTIAAFKFTTGAEAIRLYQKVNITFYTVEESEQVFKDLSKGFIDGILCDSPLAVNYVLFNKKYSGKFAIKTDAVPEGCTSNLEEYGIVVKKGNAELLSLINQGLKAVKEKGLETKIREKWMKGQPPVGRVSQGQ